MICGEGECVQNGLPRLGAAVWGPHRNSFKEPGACVCMCVCTAACKPRTWRSRITLKGLLDRTQDSWQAGDCTVWRVQPVSLAKDWQAGDWMQGTEHLRFTAAKTGEPNPHCRIGRLCRSVRPASGVLCWTHFHRAKQKKL